MSTPVFNGRRAERLAVLLEEAGGGRRHHRRTELDDELGELVGLAGRLGSVCPAPEPSPEFRQDLRAMLLATIEREGIGKTASEKQAQAAARAALAGETQAVIPVTARTARTRAAVLAGVTAGALALSGVSAASTDSLPGDALYTIKRSTEQAQLALAGSDESRGHLYLEFAAGRLDEATRVRAGAGDLLEDMDRATAEGIKRIAGAALQHGDEAALDEILRFINDQRAGLDELARQLSTADARRLTASASLLGDAESRVWALREAITEGCLLAGWDDLGPVPACR